MSKIAAVALCLVYFVCVLIGVPLIGPRIAPWFLSLLSAAFVYCYLVLARGRIAIALAVVIVVTIVFPLAALIAIGWPVDRKRHPEAALTAAEWAASDFVALVG